MAQPQSVSDPPLMDILHSQFSSQRCEVDPSQMGESKSLYEILDYINLSQDLVTYLYRSPDRQTDNMTNTALPAVMRYSSSN